MSRGEGGSVRPARVGRRVSAVPVTAVARGEIVIGVVAALYAIAGLLYVVDNVLGNLLVSVLFEVFMDVGLALGALFGAIVLNGSAFTSRERWTAAVWYLGGIVFVSLLVLWAALPDLLSTMRLESLIRPFILFGNLGGIMGLIAGFNRARAAQNRRLMGEVARRREQNEFVNHLLRHNILNRVQAIDGYADLIEPAVDGQAAHDLDALSDNSERIAALIEEVRLLLDALEEKTTTQPVALSTVLTEQVRLAQDRFADATFTTDIESDVVVTGGSVLSAVFENLLENAAIHNDSTTPDVTVRAREDGESAVVEIEDNGPGLPGDVMTRYFAGPTLPPEHGESLGLYLSVLVVERMGGEIGARETDPRGTLLTVRLPRADA